MLTYFVNKSIKRISCMNTRLPLLHNVIYQASFSSFPSHLVVNMPALSPTMSSGTIGKWTCKVGDKISAGDSLAEIETDKASMAFEAQDEFYIAKLLMEPGVEVKVGDPILVSVENQDDIAAFADFTIQPSVTVVVATPEPVKPSQPTVTVEKKESTPVISTPKVVSPPPVPSVVVTTDTTGVYFKKWSNEVGKSPLGKKLASAQAEYIKKYGTAGQKAL